MTDSLLPINHAGMKLGKLAPKRDKRVRALASLTRALPPPPASTDWSAKLSAPLGMMLNNALGDCTCAAIGHAIQVWTANAQLAQITVADSDVLSAYEGACGYVPGKPDTDQGGIEVDVLGWWQKNPVAGNLLSAFAYVQPKSRSDIKDAIWLFGGAYVGIALPISAQDQDVWTVPPGGAVGDGAPGSWGGHAVFVCAYDERTLTCITWGALKHFTWSWWDAYADEAYALLSPDWFANGNAPSGLDHDHLSAYLNEYR